MGEADKEPNNEATSTDLKYLHYFTYVMNATHKIAA